jgi:hypothetical protein
MTRYHIYDRPGHVREVDRQKWARWIENERPAVILAKGSRSLSLFMPKLVFLLQGVQCSLDLLGMLFGFRLQRSPGDLSVSNDE